MTINTSPTHARGRPKLVHAVAIGALLALGACSSIGNINLGKLNDLTGTSSIASKDQTPNAQSPTSTPAVQISQKPDSASGLAKSNGSPGSKADTESASTSKSLPTFEEFYFDLAASRTEKDKLRTLALRVPGADKAKTAPSIETIWSLASPADQNFLLHLRDRSRQEFATAAASDKLYIPVTK